MVLFRITENEPSKMHNVRQYVYSRPWLLVVLQFIGESQLAIQPVLNLTPKFRVYYEEHLILYCIGLCIW